MHLLLLSAAAAGFGGLVAAEDGINAWLRYARLPNAQQYYDDLPDMISVLNQSAASPVFTAGQELHMAFRRIFGWYCHAFYEDDNMSAFPNGSVVIVGTVEQYTKTYGEVDVGQLEGDGFWLDTTGDALKILVSCEAVQARDNHPHGYS